MLLAQVQLLSMMALHVHMTMAGFQAGAGACSGTLLLCPGVSAL